MKLKIIPTIFLSLFIILSIVFCMVYNLNYYEQQYQKHGVYDVFEKDTAIYLTKED